MNNLTRLLASSTPVQAARGRASVRIWLERLLFWAIENTEMILLVVLVILTVIMWRWAVRVSVQSDALLQACGFGG
ncbi:MAG TPA: hypothetical protein VGK74_22370 [Symbiobacteriaceae bacterium]